MSIAHIEMFRSFTRFLTNKLSLSLLTLILPGLVVVNGFNVGTTAEAKARDNDRFQQLLSKMQPGEWLELPGNISEVFVDREKTQGEGEVIGPAAVIIAWNGAAWDGNCGYFLGGGHADYGGNEVYRYCWAGEKALQWEMIMPPSKSDPDDKSQCPHPKEGPRAYHTYDGLTYVPSTESILIWGTVGFCLNGGPGVDEIAELKLKPTPKWKLHPKGVIDAFAHTAYNDQNGQVYIWQGSRQAYIADPKTLKTEASGESTADYGASANLIYDNQRNVLWAITSAGLFQFVLNTKGDVQSFTQIESSNQFPAGINGSDGMALRKGKLYFWSGNRTVIMYDPEQRKWSTYPAIKGPTRAGSNGIFSKWNYLEQYDVFVGVSHFKQGMWVWKPAEGSGQADTRNIAVCQGKSKACSKHLQLSSALKDVASGAVIQFSPGFYMDGTVINQSGLKFAGSKDVLIEGLADGKATFVAAGDNLVFDDLDISLPLGSVGSNEACFRGEGENLTLRNIHCHDVQMGVIGGPGTLLIENSRFENSGLNGNGDLGHFVYACSNDKCPNGQLIVKNSEFIKMGVNRPGHGIKSRAPKNLIEDVVIASFDSASGRAIDISQGGETIIRNAVLQLGEHSDNEDFIAIAMETDNLPMHKNTHTVIENVIAVCDRSEPCDFVRYKGPAPQLKNITLIGNFRFYDDMFPIAKDEIKIYKTRAEAGLKNYPDLPKKWQKIAR